MLPVEPASHLPEQLEHRRWMVDDLWTEQAVGIIGGKPTSFLVRDITLSVASATCLPCVTSPLTGRVACCSTPSTRTEPQRSFSCDGRLEPEDPYSVSVPVEVLAQAPAVTRLFTGLRGFRPNDCAIPPSFCPERCPRNPRLTSQKNAAVGGVWRTSMTHSGG